jgi:hypothetical protein
MNNTIYLAINFNASVVMKKYLFLLLVAVATILASCTKTEEEALQTKDCEDVLCFNNFAEFENELKSVLTLNTEEKVKWEQQRGFKSLGVAAEKFYDTIEPDAFKSLDEVKAFVEKNRKVIQLVVKNGEYSVVPIYSNNPLRFFINEEGLFLIGNEAYKVLGNGMFSTAIQNVDKLKIIDEENKNSFMNDQDLKYSTLIGENLKSTSCSNGGSDESLPITTGSKTYRTTINIWPTYFDDYQGSIAASFYSAGCQVRTLGIWWNHKTTVYTNVSTQLVYTDMANGLTIVNTSDTYTSPTLVYSVDRFAGYISSILTGYDPNPYFNSYYGRCTSDAGVGSNGEGKVEISCQ